MEVNFPAGTNFGIESKQNKQRSKKNKKGSVAIDGDGSDDGGIGTMPTKNDFDTSDRELALLFVEMFQAVGGDAISVVFRDTTLANAARTRWKGDVGSECNVLSVDRKNKGGAAGGGGGKKKKKKAVGFAAKMAEEMGEGGSGGSTTNAGGPFRLPDGCEVALFVSPGPKELVAIERICGEVGMGTLVILLNARLPSSDDDGRDGTFRSEFDPVFHLAAAPREEAPGCLLYRSYPTGWILARRPKVGPPRTIASFDYEGKRRPSREECRVAYEGVEIGDLEQGVEDVLENVASWFS